jgi:hypothetical protein
MVRMLFSLNVMLMKLKSTYLIDRQRIKLIFAYVIMILILILNNLSMALKQIKFAF